MKEVPRPPLSKVRLHQIIMLVLSVYVVLALLVRELIPIRKTTGELLDQVDTGICLYFLYDFFLRLYLAPNKWEFLRWGWIDLLSSIPAFDWGRLGQLVRIIRILRMVRAFRSIRDFLNFFFRDRANGTLAVVLLSSLLLMIFGAIAILYVERVPDANIKTPSDALWWAFVTITTVGYGDRFPITSAGRLIAAVLMIAGVGLFGTFTGYVANFFVEDEQEQTDNDIQKLISEVRQLREKIEEMEKRMP
ncbi:MULTISPECIES: potassium channel family protein [unclassified Spirosoma]|uniref:potassium channel family protein n=1 Tax=unclassified Spirosoma TaxID=2621999 RepID=UPI00095BEE9A|nr:MULTISPECIES: potassium channel family protein [unclassified Spirosoma]MBN8825308.1 potassium channel family protein [Spirosoma sp.]OJW77519.1 MAG: ion transporter [Spirosoma sp. 48-14]